MKAVGFQPSPMRLVPLTIAYFFSLSSVNFRRIRIVPSLDNDMLYSSDAPLWLWAEAAKYAAYIRNRIPSTQELMTPFDKMYQRKPDVSNIRIFGSATSVLVPDTQRTKLQSKSMEGFLVGVGETQKGYRIYVPALGKVVTSRNVIIDESRVGFKGDMTNKVASTYMPSIYDPFVEQFDPCNLTTGPAHVANQQHGAVAEQGAAAAHPLVVENGDALEQVVAEGYQAIVPPAGENGDVVEHEAAPLPIQQYQVIGENEDAPLPGPAQPGFGGDDAMDYLLANALPAGAALHQVVAPILATTVIAMILFFFSGYSI